MAGFEDEEFEKIYKYGDREYNPEEVKIYRDYCYILDSSKYNRNIACKFHDNDYGINGGGGSAEKRKTDKALLKHMRENKDPMAVPTYIAVTLFGWLFFNYKSGMIWKGQLVKKLRFWKK